MKRKYIVVGYNGDDLRWTVGVANDYYEPNLIAAVRPFETSKDIAAFRSQAEAKRYAARLNAGKPGVP